MAEIIQVYHICITSSRRASWYYCFDEYLPSDRYKKLIANSIADILRGNLDVTYSVSGVQIQDIVFTLITVIGGTLAVVFFILALRRIRNDDKLPITKKRVALIALWAMVTIVMIVSLYVFPGLMGSGATWSLVLSIVSLSLLTWLIAIILLCASITLFVAFPQHKNKQTTIS